MHRAQLMIEDWQYDALRALAERQGSSISGVLRGILAERLRPGRATGRRALEKICGIASDPGARGRDHDLHLYGQKRKR